MNSINAVKIQCNGNIGGYLKYEDDNYILSPNKSRSAALCNWPCSCLYCEIKL